MPFSGHEPWSILMITQILWANFLTPFRSLAPSFRAECLGTHRFRTPAMLNPEHGQETHDIQEVTE
jgi:hypothetical protein